MFAHIVKETVLFAFAAIIHAGASRERCWQDTATAATDARVDGAPSFLDGRERDLQFGAEFVS
jgi:hypothetical protein